MLDTIFEKISQEIQTWIRKQKNFVGHLLKLLVAILLSICATYPETMLKILLAVLSWNHYFISFFLDFSLAIYYITPIIKREYENFKIKVREGKDELLFCGVPLNKIIDYLMNYGTFKRADIEREFGVTRATYYEMIGILDSLEIFVRGENNVRRVDVRLSKNDILCKLSPPPDYEIFENPEQLGNHEEQATQTVGNPFTIRRIT